MKKLINRFALVAALSPLLAAVSANAANTFFTTGDLVLYFQKEGSNNTVYVSLGNTATLYRGAAAGAADGVNRINFLNINSTLTAAYGANWASDGTIYAGLAGVWGSSNTSRTLQNGDPNRTVYVSSARQGVGNIGEANSSGYSIPGQTAMTGAASNILSQNLAFANNYDAQATVSLKDVSRIDDYNPLISAPGVTIQDTAFNTFAGGVQQVGSATSIGTYGDAGQVEFALDLYRILARNDISGQVGGTVGQGSYEGTVTVGTNGDISFIAVPEPSALALGALAAGSLVLRRRRNNA